MVRTVSEQRDRLKCHVEGALARDGFRRVRVKLVWSFFHEHEFAYLEQWKFSVQRSGSDWHIRPDWRHRLDWDDFRREQLSLLSEKQVEGAFRDLEALGLVNITHEGSQVVVCRIEVDARECVA